MRVCDHLYELRLFEQNLADSKHRHSMINPSSTVFDMIVCAQDNLIIMICHLLTYIHIPLYPRYGFNVWPTQVSPGI